MKDDYKFLKITPTDTLFLGGGRSFNMEESSWHKSQLFPYPSVFYGAICSAMLEKNPVRRIEYFEKRNCTKYFDKLRHRSAPSNYLTLGMVYLYNQKSRDLYLPAPKDLFVKDQDKFYYGKFVQKDAELDSSLKDQAFYLQSPMIRDVERADGIFLNWFTFINSYFNNFDSLEMINLEKMASYYYKVGIKRNQNMTVDEQHIYRLDMLDFHQGEWSYLVEYQIDDKWWESENVPNELGEGFLKLGGENKSCRYEQFDNEVWKKDYKNQMLKENKSEYIKLLIMSPIFFTNNSWKPEFSTDEIKVLASVTSSPYSIGGFDMILKRPKPMRKAIPEGCVYLLQSNTFKNMNYKAIKEKILELTVFGNADLGYSQFEVLPINQKQIGGITVE